MLSKRAAIVAIFSGVLAKMAHADDPNWKPTPMSQSGVLGGWNQPTTWTVNLDQMKSLDVILGGNRVTISATEIFAALSA